MQVEREAAELVMYFCWSETGTVNSMLLCPEFCMQSITEKIPFCPFILTKFRLAGFTRQMTSAEGDKWFACTAFGTEWFYIEGERAHGLHDTWIWYGWKIIGDRELMRGQKRVTILLSTIGCEGGDQMADGQGTWRRVNAVGPPR